VESWSTDRKRNPVGYFEATVSDYVACRRAIPGRLAMATEDLVHEHRYTIHVGNAPVVMMDGHQLPIERACACGETITVGYYFYDPD
jgi:hypothetical protein